MARWLGAHRAVGVVVVGKPRPQLTGQLSQCALEPALQPEEPVSPQLGKPAQPKQTNRQTTLSRGLWKNARNSGTLKEHRILRILKKFQVHCVLMKRKMWIIYIFTDHV